MARRISIILCIAFVLLTLGYSGAAQPPKSLNVQVREAQLRSTPSFLGKIIAKPSYGDRVELIEEQGAWKRVAIRGGVQGWMHTSALTTKSITPQAGAQSVQTSATGGEIALAGKGFSEEVEKQYKKDNRNVDFTWVDKMEKLQVTPEEMQAFLREGNVVPPEGGVR
jgi:hypothetical protein